MNKETEGVRCGNVETKIAIYADNVVCCLKNPLTTVSALTSILKDVGRVSGYKISHGKSILLGFYVPEGVKNEVLKILPGKWQGEGIRYLGIRLSRSNIKMMEEDEPNNWQY